MHVSKCYRRSIVSQDHCDIAGGGITDIETEGDAARQINGIARRSGNRLPRLVNRINRWSSRNRHRQSKQGDIAFLDILQQMGCTVNERDHFIEVTGTTKLMGVDVDMQDIPDTAQTLAAIAPFASSPTTIRGIASARLKETDRVHATCMELVRLGVCVDEHDDGMTIYPCDKIQPATIQTYNDHRMAMAFSLVGLRVSGIMIENPACVAKTFPNFFEVLDCLR